MYAWEIWEEGDLRLAAISDIFLISVGFKKGQAKMTAVLISASVHSGRPRRTSVV